MLDSNRRMAAVSKAHIGRGRGRRRSGMVQMRENPLYSLGFAEWPWGLFKQNSLNSRAGNRMVPLLNGGGRSLASDPTFGEKTHVRHHA